MFCSLESCCSSHPGNMQEARVFWDFFSLWWYLFSDQTYSWERFHSSVTSLSADLGEGDGLQEQQQLCCWTHCHCASSSVAINVALHTAAASRVCLGVQLYVLCTWKLVLNLSQVYKVKDYTKKNPKLACHKFSLWLTLCPGFFFFFAQFLLGAAATMKMVRYCVFEKTEFQWWTSWFLWILV